MTKTEFRENEAGYNAGFEAGRRSNHVLIMGLSNLLAVAMTHVRKRPELHEAARKWWRLVQIETNP
jgi:hypothetical protein